MPVSLSPEAKRKLDGLLSEYPASGSPGTVVGVINQQGKMIYLNAAGNKNGYTEVPMRTDNVFAIFSCTKIITAIACMQLVERNLIDLDEPLDELCPGLANKDIIIESTPTEIKTRKAVNKITLRMLLTHTAGFAYSWYNQHIKNWTDQNEVDVFRGQHLGMPLASEPGTKYEYSIAMDWAGKVVEAVTGLTLGEFCQDNIFGPLGLKDSAFDLKDRPDLLERLCGINTWDTKSNTFTEGSYPRGTVNVPIHSGGGGLFCTTSDFLQVIAALMNKGVGPNGTRILSKETVESMFEDQCADVPDRGALGTDAVVVSTDRTKAETDLALMPGIPKGWGLSFLMNLEDKPHGRKANSAEWGGVANLLWFSDPSSEIAVMICNNVLPYGLPSFEKLEGDVERTLYEEGALIKSK